MKLFLEKRSVVIAVSWAFLPVYLLYTQPAYAQRDSSERFVTSLKNADSISLQEVVISENRLQIPFTQQNRNIQVIDRKQIDALPARSINELLSHIGGVDLRQRGPFG